MLNQQHVQSVEVHVVLCSTAAAAVTAAAAAESACVL
jgi:hypothetical protein